MVGGRGVYGVPGGRDLGEDGREDGGEALCDGGMDYDAFGGEANLSVVDYSCNGNLSVNSQGSAWDCKETGPTYHP